MFVGGIASNYYGSPRPTYDVDVVMAEKPENADEFLIAFRKAGLRFHEKEIKAILPISNRLIMESKDSLFRVDIWFSQGDFEKKAMERRKKGKIAGRLVLLISPEDIVLEKLRSGRAKDEEDILNIFLRQGDRLDMRYIRDWSKIFNLEDVLSNILKKIDRLK